MTKSQLKLVRKRRRSSKAISCPSNNFSVAPSLNDVVCYLSLMGLGKKLTEKKRKSGKLRYFCVFENNYIQSHESHTLQNEIIKLVCLFVRRKPLRSVIIQNKSYVHKNNVKYRQKSITYLLFFGKNPCRSQYCHNEIFKKKFEDSRLLSMPIL